MKKEEREALRLRVATFHTDTAGSNLKTTWNFFKKEGYCYSTIYRIIQRCAQFKTTKDLPRFGRPRKLNNKQMKSIVLTSNNNSRVFPWGFNHAYKSDRRF